MPFSMKASNEQIEGKDVFQPGQYELKLVSFKPKASKAGTSFNYNPGFEVINHPEHAGRKIYDTWNSGAAWLLSDYSHAFGLPLDTDGKDSWLPGVWDADKAKFDPEKPETWVYKGPLLGRVAKVEVVIDSYNGKENNKINRYFCAVPNCATKFPKIRHAENLVTK